MQREESPCERQDQWIHETRGTRGRCLLGIGNRGDMEVHDIRIETDDIIQGGPNQDKSKMKV